MTNEETLAKKRPDWIRVKASNSEGFFDTLRVVKTHGIHTVCEEALCPNIAECWKNKTATFLVLGDVCTRKCGFCNIKAGLPSKIDEDEPKKIAKTIKDLGIKYAIITSVTRDDLQDGGANHFANIIAEIRSANPKTRVEILTPDFRGDERLIEIVVNAKPDVFGHNVETVERVHKTVKRPPSNYQVSLGFLRKVKEISPSMITKTGLIVGVGETKSEVYEFIEEVADSKVDIITIGQYLIPSTAHYPIARYVTPEEFEEFKKYGENRGLTVVSGPLVRSSYKALEAYGAVCYTK